MEGLPLYYSQRGNYERIKQECERSPRNLTTHRGPKCQNEELELSLYNRVLAERGEENLVSTSDIIDKALSLNPDFESANQITLTNRVYRFIKRRGFSIRTRTRVSQITDAAVQPVRRDYCWRLMTSYGNRINGPHYLISMDETAVFLHCASNRTVHVKEKKTVSVMIASASSMRFILAVSVAMDGSKLSLFAIFKGKPGGSIEKQLPQIIPVGIVSCVQAKGWMDDRTMSI